MNNEVIDVKPLYLNEPKLALDFLIRNLEFAIHRHTASKNPDSVTVCDNYGNFYEVVLNTPQSETSRNNPPLVINTTDCLQVFHMLELKGIIILTRPHYIPEGLAFEICDYWYNRYTFLEKRDYTDQ